MRDQVRIERVEDELAPASGPPAAKGGGKKRRRGGASVDVSDVQFKVPSPETERKLQRRLIEAAGAFEAERFADAHRLLNSIDSLAPGVAEVLELRGLASYRMGKWRQAEKDLEAFAEVSGTVEQHPVLADCARAQSHWGRVDELWRELGEASPSPELVEEGRIVMAGSLADQRKFADGIRLLEQAPRAPRKPKVQHLRRWYALADLYERAGEIPKARRLFAEINTLDPTFGDAGQRAKLLR